MSFKLPFHQVMLLCCLLAFAASNQFYKRADGYQSDFSVRSVLPGEVAVLLALGDRYLLANITMIRVLVGDFGQDLTFKTKLQQQIAIANPRLEDNAYSAIGVLAWQGHLDEALGILKHMSAARYWDHWPAFFVGFAEMHFNGDGAEAAKYIQQAALRREGDERTSLQFLASKWSARAEDPGVAIALLQHLIANSANEELKAHMRLREQGLIQLVELRRAAKGYFEKYGKNIKSFQDLVEEGLIERLPAHPFSDHRYRVDDDGRPVIQVLEVKKP